MNFLLSKKTCSTSAGPSTSAATGSSDSSEPSGPSISVDIPSGPTSAGPSISAAAGSSKSSGPSISIDIPSGSTAVIPPTSVSGPSTPIADKGKGKVSLISRFKKEGLSSKDQIALDAKNSNIRLKLNEGIRLIGRTETFTFKKLQEATDDFNSNRLLGEGRFGRFGTVFRGNLSFNRQVAVKRLDTTRGQGLIHQFVTEVKILDLVNHSNIIRFIGYCAENDERLLVYELVAGSLKNHLFDLKPGTKPLDWMSRMRIIEGLLKGLEYLHKKSIIHGNLNSSSILLDRFHTVKLSGFGSAKVVGEDDDTCVNAAAVPPSTWKYYYHGSYERRNNNVFTMKSDVYSIGICLLEIMTGRKALDLSKPYREQLLTEWAKPLIWTKKFGEIVPSLLSELVVDPSLENLYNYKAAQQVLELAASCIEFQPENRPDIRNVNDRWKAIYR